MTPKEKAKELVDKLYQTTPNEAWYNPPLGSLSIEYKAWEQAKQCALIAVDEILSIQVVKNGYWQEVKAEIEKL
jgi:predicted Zn-dependent protease